MSDTNKRRVFAALSRNDLLLLGRTFKLQISPRMSMEELHGALAKSGRAAKLDAILRELPDASLAKIGGALGLPEGEKRDAIIVRILEATGEAVAPAPAPEMPPVQEMTSAPVEVAAVSAPAAAEVAPAAASNGTDLRLSIEVEPRKPRLAWQGMDRRERVVSVPTQVVEIVRPGRAVDRGDSLLNTEARAAAARTESALPPNRLIWTNDNLVALATLLDERDPVTKDYRYRGKVDLIYIDPPFMVNNDFRADNSYDKEPWHYLLLIENEPSGRADITWWERLSVQEIGRLLQHHESLPLYPDEEPLFRQNAFQILETVSEAEQFQSALPV